MGIDLEDRSIGVAMVGTGVIARVIVDALATVEGAQLRLVAGRRAEAARELALPHGARWTTPLDQWIATDEASDIDLVVVTTPSGTHADVVVPLLEAGKDVLVEKPLDVSLEAADRIRAAEASSGRVVAVVSQHRFDESFARLQQAVESGDLGRLTSVVVSCAWWRPQAYYDSAPWRGTPELDGGVAMNQAIHLIDLMLAVMGPVARVQAFTGTLAHEDISVEDTAVVAVEFVSGALGTIHATTAAYPGVEASLRVFGDRGSAAIVDDRLVLLTTAEEDPGGEAPPMGAAHAEQLAEVVDVIARRRAGELTARPRVGTPEARAALALVLAIYESAARRQPVELPR